MKANPLELWTKFKTAFGEALNEHGREDLLAMWQAVKEKTYFYEWRLMPAVGKRIGYKLEIEKQRCDYTFVDQEGVPLIAVESENNHSRASHEIHCLCCLSAPLKVLLISCDWKASEREKFLPRWTEIICKHHAVVSLDCLYGIVVGEWDDPADALLEYSFTLLDPTGNVLDEHRHVVHE